MAGFIDTATVPLERLESARKHIHWAATVTIIISVFIAAFTIVAAETIGEYLLFISLDMIFLVLSIGFVLKREMYSLAIFIRRKEE